MMNLSISVMSIITIVFAFLCGIAIPLSLGLICSKKFNGKTAIFFIGCAVFILFAILLEAIPKIFLFTGNCGQYLLNHSFLYCLVGSLLAGIFEETGRFATFKIMRCKKIEAKYGQIADNQSLMFASGYGGFEAFYILCISMAMNLFFAICMKTGNIEFLLEKAGSDTAGQVNATLLSLSNTPWYMFLVSVVERILAVILQIELTILVWYSAKENRLWFLYPIALLIHALIDFVASYSNAIGWPIWSTELIILGYDVILAFFALFIWKKHSSKAFCDNSAA